MSWYRFFSAQSLLNVATLVTKWLLAMVLLVGVGALFWYLPENQQATTVLSLPGDPWRSGINLNAERRVEQVFEVPAEANRISFRRSLGETSVAVPGELAIVVVRESDQHAVVSTTVPLAEVVSHRDTTVSVPDGLWPGERYYMQLALIDPEDDFTLPLPYVYADEEPAARGLVRIIDSSEGQETVLVERPGSLRMDFAYQPGFEDRWHSVWQIVAIPLLLITLLAFIGGWYWQPGDTRAPFVAIRQVATTTAWFLLPALVVAIGITLPLYVDPQAISSHGDVNRGLVYHAVARDHIMAGYLPLWEPYLCGGTPLLANLEGWFLQPFFGLLFFLPAPLAMKISYTLTIAVAFLGFAWLGKRVLALSNGGALVFALMAAAGSYISHHLAEGYYVWIAAAWVPWFILAVVASWQRPLLIPVAALFPVFMFGSGSMTLVFYASLFLGVVAVYQAFMTRSARPLVGLVVILVLAFGFSAVKLLPALTLLDISESRPGLVPSLTLLPRMLLSRDVSPLIWQGEIYRWSEFGNYIGYGSLVLIGAGAVAVGRRWRGVWREYRFSFLVASLLLLGLAFTELPTQYGLLASIGDLLRMPSRLMIFPMIGLALLGAWGFEWLWSWRQSWWWRVGLAGLVGFIVIDLMAHDQTLFAAAFPTPLLPVERRDEFRRVRHSFSIPDDGTELYYRAGYLNYLQNEGTNDLCRYYQQTATTRAADTSNPLQPYFGEAWLAEGNGEVRVDEVRPWRTTVYVMTPWPATLIVNQSYYPGWQSTMGEVINYNGLVGVVLPAGEHEVVLRYRPAITWWGMGVSGSSFGLALVWMGLISLRSYMNKVTQRKTSNRYE